MGRREVWGGGGGGGAGGGGGGGGHNTHVELEAVGPTMGRKEV